MLTTRRMSMGMLAAAVAAPRVSAMPNGLPRSLARKSLVIETRLNNRDIVHLAEDLGRTAKTTHLTRCVSAADREDHLLQTVMHGRYPHQLCALDILPDVCFPNRKACDEKGSTASMEVALRRTSMSVAGIASLARAHQADGRVVILGDVSSVKGDLPSLHVVVFRGGAPRVIKDESLASTASLNENPIQRSTCAGRLPIVFASGSFDREGRYDPVRIVRSETHLLRHHIARPSGDPAVLPFELLALGGSRPIDVSHDPDHRRTRQFLIDMLRDWRMATDDNWRPVSPPTTRNGTP